MGWYPTARRSRPGRWLIGALAADVIIYAFAREGSSGVIGWLLLDLWLAHRIWNGGARSLTVFRFLQTLGAILFGFAITFAGPMNIDTPVTPLMAALYALSAWCLFAPALDVAVTRRHLSALPAN